MSTTVTQLLPFIRNFKPTFTSEARICSNSGALQRGDLAGAQQEFKAIQDLAQSGPFANGDAFKISQRQQEFTALG